MKVRRKFHIAEIGRAHGTDALAAQANVTTLLRAALATAGIAPDSIVESEIRVTKSQTTLALSSGLGIYDYTARGYYDVDEPDDDDQQY